MPDPIESNNTVSKTGEDSDENKSVAQAGGTNGQKQPAAQAGGPNGQEQPTAQAVKFDPTLWAGIDGMTEGWDTPGATTETPSATTATPSISAVNDDENGGGLGKLDSLLKNFNLEGSQNKDLNARAAEDLDKILEKTGIAGITDEQLKEAAKMVEEIRKKQEREKAIREAEAKKKEKEKRVEAAMDRKKKARRASLEEYEAEAKRKKSFFGNIGRRRKSAPADSLSSNSLQIDELEWRSFNTWVLDLASGLRDCSSSFNRIVSKKRKEFEVEPLKNDETYNPYNPVYVIHYFKDFWDKIKGFYGAEKVKLEGSNDVDEFIKTIDKEKWEEYGWENPEFSTDPKNLKGEEPKLDKDNEVIKAFEGWLEIIKNNIINLQDKVGKKNIEKISESEKKWEKYNELVKKYNSFVAEQSKIVNSQISKELLERINKNDRKAQEIATRIVHPIFVDEKFEGSKGSKSAEVLKNFLNKQAQKCEAGKASTKYEKLKAILSDADMRGDAGTLCTRLRDFYNVLISSNRNLVATLLSGHANNIRNLSVNSGQLEGLEKEFNELLDGVERNIEDLGKVYNNVEKAYNDDKSIIGEDHDFIFGKDENNCWRVYQNEDGTEKEIGYIAEVYYKVVKKEDKKQEVNVSPKDPNGGVIPYKGARTYGSVSSYLQKTQGYLSFENNFTPNGEIKCYYTDEEGKENSVTFNANGMAIKINRQGQKKEVDESSSAFKQLKQAFEGNQSSSIPPQGNLDINNNEKNEGGINMAETETTKIEAAKRQLIDFVEKYNEFLSSRSEFAEKHMELKDDFNKGILKDYQVDWWDKFEKYELGDLSDINLVKVQWSMVLADLIRKYLPTGESNSTTKEIFDIGTKFNSAKSNEEKLSILGKFHTEAKELLKKVEDKLVELNNFSERIKNRGSAFEGLTDRLEKDKPKGKHKAFKSIKKFLFGHKESGSANSGANTGYVIEEEENKFVAKELKKINEYKEQCETFRGRHSEFLEKEKCKEIIDSQMDGTQFNKETWKNKPAEIEWLPGHDGNRLYNLPFKYRSMAKLLINYFKEGSSEYTKYKNIIDESNSEDYGKKTIRQKIDFTSKAIESLGDMLWYLNGELYRLEGTEANGGEKTDEDVGETNVNEDAEQKEEPKATETVEAPKSEEGAKPLTVEEMNAKRESAVKDNQFKKELPSAPVPVDKNGMPMDGLPPTPPEQAAANGGEKTNENVSKTNENEEKERELLGTSSSEFGAIRIVNKAVKKYNEFVEDYNGFVDGLKSSDDLKNLINKVLKKEPEENSIWLNRNVRRSISSLTGLSTIKELNTAWMDLIQKLLKYLPEANRDAFSTKANKISRAIISDNDIDNSEKLKLMEKYNKMCDKMLNYTNSVLKRLKRKAEHKGYLKEETAEEKLLKEFVKKYNELLSRGYEIAQTSGNGSASGIDGEWRSNFSVGYQLYLVDDNCDMPVRWSNAFKYLIDNVLPEGDVKVPEENVKETFRNKLGDIGTPKTSRNSVNKSKVLKKYHKLSEELFNETKNALDRLEETAANGGKKTNENVMNTNENEEAEQKEETKATTEENKGLFSRIKGKASKLVRKGKKVVAHKLDNSEKELDAAQKELKVLDEHAGASGAEGRFVKQSVMDQPEYETFKAVGQIIVNTNTRGNFGKIFDKLKEGPSSAKSLRSKLKVMITDNNISKWKLGDGKEFEAKVGVLYIGIAYLPSGSKGIEAACKGLSVGGIKGSNDETIQKVYNVNRAMKKFCRDGTVGHALVKKVEEQLVALVNKDCIPKIESKFSTLLKLKRKAAKLGSKAKETAKKAATKIGKSSVGRAAKSVATTAGGGIKSAARSVKKGILKRIKGSKSKKDSVKQETGVIDLEKPNTGEKSSFWVEEDE